MAKTPTKQPQNEAGAATAAKTDLTVAENQALLPVDADMLMEDSGAGNENLTMKDLSVPYLTVLQGQSPQVMEGTAKYIDGARAGMILNTATGELYGGKPEHGLPALVVVPVAYERKYIEWLDRDAGGGGFIGEHDITSDILKHTRQDDRKRLVLKTDATHLIVETAYHYVLAYSPQTGQWERCIISLKSTGLRINRNWNQAISRVTIRHPTVGVIQAPRWFYPWDIATISETSKTNKTYFNWTVKQGERPVSKDVYLQARAFNEEFAKGLVKRGEDTVSDVERAGGDDPIPF